LNILVKPDLTCVIDTGEIKDYIKVDDNRKEELYIGTASSEHVEMYLKAIWFIRVKGEEVKLPSIARLLNVRPPSLVSMLHKLNEADLVTYKSRRIVDIIPKGERIGNQMIRNTRLLEVLMKDASKMEIDKEMVCGIEQHMKQIFTDALGWKTNLAQAKDQLMEKGA